MRGFLVVFRRNVGIFMTIYNFETREGLSYVVDFTWYYTLRLIKKGSKLIFECKEKTRVIDLLDLHHLEESL